MQPPFAGFAIDPGEARLAQPCDEIVAPRLVAVPPAALDALRPGEQREGALGEPPRLEEPGRPRPGLAELARLPVARRHAPPGAFRPVVGIEAEAVHRLAPEARLQPLDEPRPVLGVGRRVAEQAAAVPGERLEVPRFHDDAFRRLRELRG